MDSKKMYECGICYFQGSTKDFAPKTASANLAALECPKCLNNDADSFAAVKVAELKLVASRAA